jgi:large subunit ribosomal protein L22
VATTTEKREVRAQAKWVRTSARKARLVAEHIRGRPVAEARAVLAFTPRAAAREMEKVLRSAVANAEANHGLHGDDLVVHAAYVDEGPTLKRWRARARGRVARIRKRTCHITVILEQSPEALKRASTPQRSRRPSVRRAKSAPGAETTAEPKTETVAETAETPEAPAEPAAEEKPKRRAPVRRKKTEEKES